MNSIPVRIVPDTSILVAALFHSRSNRIVREWKTSRIQFCCSPAILKEYRHIMEKIPPIRIKAKTLLDRIEDSEQTCWIEKPVAVCVEIEDPADRKFIECAAAASAEYIVSLDDHLLKIRGFQDIQIVTPKEFLAYFQKRFPQDVSD